jgi:P-type Cu+ transporter
MNLKDTAKKEIKCFHCGDDCRDESISANDKIFCCTGCKTVYEMLNQNQLCNYYTIENSPGISPKNLPVRKFDYLDDMETIQKLIDFKNDKISSITFYIPQMHCSSCIWLLENLHKLNQGVSQSNVNFLKKELSIKYFHSEISFKELVKLLASIGYEPLIQLDSTEQKKDVHRKHLYYKIGIAAFCFGNIMLLSFPEYLSIDISDSYYRTVFAYINLILALPVFFYSASEYFGSAIKGLRKKIVNIDFPISLGIFVLFARSVFEVLVNNNAGYFDSMSGLVLFLLIGKLFQEKTYETLNFERSYRSYFPLGVTVKKDNKETSLAVGKLKVGDRIIIRNNEIIPADAILFTGNGNIDYSFVTGESSPVKKVLGELVYAGGRQTGSVIELEVVKEVSQSYLTQLWNHESFNKKDESYFTTISNAVSKYFTAAVLLIAAVSALFWLQTSVHTAINVFTAVLIVACPCALALSTPFTFGNTVRIFGRNKFYLKNSSVVEDLAKINRIVFDKTGTITKAGEGEANFVGDWLDDFKKEIIKALVKNSTHPLSTAIHNSLKKYDDPEISEFKEYSGLGIEGKVLGNNLKLGSLAFVDESLANFKPLQNENPRVYVSINERTYGYFEINNNYREGIEKVVQDLSDGYKLSVLSGDNEGEKVRLQKLFGENSELYFRQTPNDKLSYVEKMQNDSENVLMVGDGLNDAGALRQSNVGIAVTENISSFSPACDAILDAEKLNLLPEFIKFSKTSVRIIIASFIISFLYNAAGLTFAIEGMLSPLVAAILMPLSSISVVLFATLSTNLIAAKRGLLSL